VDLSAGEIAEIHSSDSISPSSLPASASIGGFHNPNYDSSHNFDHEQDGDSSGSANGPRRFYYAALSPSNMGVNEPLLFLSPDDQVNNNSTIPPEEPVMTPRRTVETKTSAPVASDGSVNNGSSSNENSFLSLPPGWERHDDTNGPYYWHIKSGTIQRDPPTVQQVQQQALASNPALLIPGALSNVGGTSTTTNATTSNVTFRRSQTISSQMSSVLPQSGSSLNTSNNNSAAVLAEKRKSWSQYLDNNIENKLASMGYSSSKGSKESRNRGNSGCSLRFVAVSLGCLSISEEDLTPERSSRAVSKVIAELTNPNSKVASG